MKTKDQGYFKARQDKIDKCSACSENQTFKAKSGYDYPSSQLRPCVKFKALSVGERAYKLESLTGCALWTSFNHKRDGWTLEKRLCGIAEKNSKC